MIGGLPAELIRAKNELTALKTAHRHGLGMTVFFRKIAQITGLTPSRLHNITLTATFQHDLVVFPPYFSLQMLTNVPQADGEGVFAGSDWPSSIDVATKTMNFEIRLISETSEATVQLISSSQIDKLEWELTE